MRLLTLEPPTKRSLVRKPAARQLEQKKYASSSAEIWSSTSNSGSTISSSSDRNTAHAGGKNLQLPHRTTISVSIPSMQNDTAAVPRKSFTGTSTIPVNPVLSIHDSMAAEPTKLSQSPRKSLTGPVKVQPANITPNEAYEALLVAIDYCRSKPEGYLTIKEGVLLGKFELRLERYCGLLDTR